MRESGRKGIKGGLETEPLHMSGQLPFHHNPPPSPPLNTSLLHPPASHFLGQWVHLVVPAATLTQALGIMGTDGVQLSGAGQVLGQAVLWTASAEPRTLSLCHPCRLPNLVPLGVGLLSGG